LSRELRYIPSKQRFGGVGGKLDMGWNAVHDGGRGSDAGNWETGIGRRSRDGRTRSDI
jgi:hypothetical protein